MPPAASAAAVTDDADASQATVAVPQSRNRPQKQPRYHVVLWNDDDHTYEYVIGMLKQLFGLPAERGFELAKEVDRKGRAVVLTTTKEHAELKRDQIHAFGADQRLSRSKGAMTASIEAE